MNNLIDKINELHAVLDYSDYSALMDYSAEAEAEIAALKAENERLKAKLFGFYKGCLYWEGDHCGGFNCCSDNEDCPHFEKSQPWKNKAKLKEDK